MGLGGRLKETRAFYQNNNSQNEGRIKDDRSETLKNWTIQDLVINWTSGTAEEGEQIKKRFKSRCLTKC